MSCLLGQRLICRLPTQLSLPFYYSSTKVICLKTDQALNAKDKEKEKEKTTSDCQIVVSLLKSTNLRPEVASLD